MKKIGVIGAGSWGTALALTLSISMQTMFLLYCLTGNPLYDSQMLIPYLCSCAMGEYYILRINRKREG